MHEVRYHGKTVARFATESEAAGYRTRRLSHEIEGPAFDRDALTVAPAKPVSLFCAGNLVETYDTEAQALEARNAIEDQAKSVRPGHRGYEEDAFAITKTAP